MKQDDAASLGRAIVGLLVSRADDAALETIQKDVDHLIEAFPAYPEGFKGYA
jgi:hypothetical protein